MTATHFYLSDRYLTTHLQHVLDHRCVCRQKYLDLRAPRPILEYQEDLVQRTALALDDRTHRRTTPTRVTVSVPPEVADFWNTIQADVCARHRIVVVSPEDDEGGVVALYLTTTHTKTQGDHYTLKGIY